MTYGVFAWSCSNQEDPTVVGSLVGKDIAYLAVGANYSAAITEEGLLYTWGKGSYGRLGHGESRRNVASKCRD